MSHIACSIIVRFYGGCEGKLVFLYIYLYFKMPTDLFLNLYKIFLIEGLNYLPQGLVKQEIFALLQESLTRLDIEACCSLMSFLGCIILNIFCFFVLFFFLSVHWNIQDFLSSSEHYT